jgi:sec-independent protein translocase protein TatA
MLATIFSGYDDLIVIIVAVVVLFGGTQLPRLARNAGEAMREFRKAHSEASAAVSGASELPAPATNAPVAPSQSPVAGAAALQTEIGPETASEERVTLSRAELDALLAAREAQARATTGSPANQS